MAILHDFVVSTQPRPPDGVKAFYMGFAFNWR